MAQQEATDSDGDDDSSISGTRRRVQVVAVAEPVPIVPAVAVARTVAVVGTGTSWLASVDLHGHLLEHYKDLLDVAVVPPDAGLLVLSPALRETKLALDVLELHVGRSEHAPALFVLGGENKNPQGCPVRARAVAIGASWVLPRELTHAIGGVILDILGNARPPAFSQPEDATIATPADALAIRNGLVFRGRREIALSGADLVLWEYLYARRGRVVGFDDIARDVVGGAVSAWTVPSRIKRLRQKLGDTERAIIRSVGDRAIVLVIPASEPP